MQDFEDRVYLEKLGESLWSNGTPGGASVMVGAGFSLNAKPISADSRGFRTWSELVDKMKQELSLESDYGALKTAMLYEKAFGRPALEKLLSDAVPNKQYDPGELHRRLVKLPWRDVFTTNYDTLLERAAAEVPFRSYETVNTPNDLSSRQSPRIVKLNGSFPSHRPFTITEEDFRVYPQEHAPFVNTVRQSLIENAFCLIGFSGDDPNFIEWSGWVRDFLGDHAPTIYLMGVLDISSAERKYLEGRNIQPIDLGALEPAGIRKRHERALEHAIEFLATSCRPPDPSEWPPSRASHSSETPEDPGEYAADLAVNRRSYPGWLVAPTVNRPRNAKTDIIRALTEVESSDATFAHVELAYEVLWRRDKRLEPLDEDWCGCLQKLLEQFREKNGLNLDHHNSDTVLFLALNLVRLARERQELQAFDDWLEVVKKTPEVPGTHLAKFRWEEGLFHLMRCEFQSVEELVEDWPDSTDPFDEVRRAALLVGLGRVDKARELVSKCLHRLRVMSSSPAQNREIYFESREGWMMLFIEQIMTNIVRSRDYDRENARKRFDELGRRRCNARGDFYNALQNAVRKTKNGKGSTSKRYKFWPGQTTRTSSYRMGPPPALRILRLLDTAALPVETPGVSVIPEDAYEALLANTEFAPFWTLSVFLRDRAVDALPIWLSRHRVASLPAEWFKWLATCALKLLQYAWEKIDHDASRDELARLNFALELVSRIAIRFDNERRNAALSLLVKIANCSNIRFRVGSDGPESLLRGLFGYAPTDWVYRKLPDLHAIRIPPPGAPYPLKMGPFRTLRIPEPSEPPAETKEQLREGVRISFLKSRRLTSDGHAA